mmetsp:Transcript_53186/g.173017  ORF Transcript_53186/g.173017 Transcript_53186/m.173017 type:complete len:248 (-) Transcript_53186:704-1447(-)
MMSWSDQSLDRSRPRQQRCRQARCQGAQRDAAEDADVEREGRGDGVACTNRVTDLDGDGILQKEEHVGERRQERSSCKHRVPVVDLQGYLRPPRHDPGAVDVDDEAGVEGHVVQTIPRIEADVQHLSVVPGSPSLHHDHDGQRREQRADENPKVRPVHGLVHPCRGRAAVALPRRAGCFWEQAHARATGIRLGRQVCAASSTSILFPEHERCMLASSKTSGIRATWWQPGLTKCRRADRGYLVLAPT